MPPLSLESSEATLRLQVDTLQREIRKLQLEHDLLKKANELLKKGLGVDPRLLDNQEKTLLVNALRAEYDLAELLSELGLARSSYFYHWARALAGDKYKEVRGIITGIFEDNYRCYGYRRMRATLSREQFCLSEKVVRRLMKDEGLRAASPKRRRFGSYQGEIGAAPDNLINRDFKSAVPNEKWLTDISEFQIPAGKIYLSPMVD